MMALAICGNHPIVSPLATTIDGDHCIMILSIITPQLLHPFLPLLLQTLRMLVIKAMMMMMMMMVVVVVVVPVVALPIRSSLLDHYSSHRNHTEKSGKASHLLLDRLHLIPQWP